MTFRPFTAAAFVFAVACDQTAPIPAQPDLPSDDPRQAVLLEAECAIYFAAVQQVEAEGGAVRGNPTRGCPSEAAAIPSDINPMVSFPPLMSGYPQTLYQRMLARGIPEDVANDVAQSKAFWDLVARRDSLMADF